jgi:hypothetical protein
MLIDGCPQGSRQSADPLFALGLARECDPKNEGRPPRRVGERLATRKPALAIWHRLGLRKASVSDLHVGRLLLDARAVPQGGLVDCVGAPVVGPSMFPSAVR